MSIADPLWAHIDRGWSQQPSGGLVTGHCEIFGPADSGPRHLQGGRFPASYNGRIHWYCEQPGSIRVRIHCVYAHSRGECAGHCGGITVPVCAGHYRMFHRRFNKACTACAQPPEQISLEEQYYDYGYRYANAQQAGDYEYAQALASRLADVQAAMAELMTRGVVRRAELFMEEVS